MKLSQKQKLILAIVIFALTGYVLYSTFKSDSPITTGDTGNTIPTDGVSIIDGLTATEFNQNQDIIDLAKEFELVSVNIGVFNSPLFLNLKDINTELIPENSGRPNPFSPIGVDSSAVKTQVQTGTSPASSLGPKTVSEI